MPTPVQHFKLGWALSMIKFPFRLSDIFDSSISGYEMMLLEMLSIQIRKRFLFNYIKNKPT